MATLAEDFRDVFYPGPHGPRPLFRDAGLHLALCGGVLAVTILAALSTATLGWRGAATALLSYGLMAGLIMLGLMRHAHPPRFGLANAITLTRAALTALLFGVAGERLFGGMVMLDGGMRWTVAGAATLILILDGLDGQAARRNGMASDFGARFDMEADVLFIIALSSLAQATGTVGAWIVACASLHYAFLIAGRFVPRLNAPLPPLWRRKAIYVVQAGTLIIALTPLCPSILALGLCEAACLFVLYSFTADSLWLLMNTPGSAESVAEDAAPHHLRRSRMET